MAPALLAARFVRRAASASSSFPLTTVARCWAGRSSASSATAVLPAGGLAAHASAASSLITARRRCMASHSAASSSETSEKKNLLELIDDEISDAADLISEGDAGDAPKTFPFEVASSNRGADSVMLKREFAGEIIKVVVHIDYYTILESFSWYSSDGDYVCVPYPKIDRMVITVEKAEGSILKFNCKFFKDSKAYEPKYRLMVVQKVGLLNCGDCDSQYVYKGASCRTNDNKYWREAQDDELQKALRRYLEVRGVKVDWDYWSWLCEYVESLEDNELFFWQKLKAFIKSSASMISPPRI